MGFIWTIIVGFVIGVLAKLLHPGRDNMGFIMTTLIGIGGSYPGCIPRPGGRLVRAWPAGGTDRIGDRRDHPARHLRPRRAGSAPVPDSGCGPRSSGSWSARRGGCSRRRAAHRTCVVSHPAMADAGRRASASAASSRRACACASASSPRCSRRRRWPTTRRWAAARRTATACRSCRSGRRRPRREVAGARPRLHPIVPPHRWTLTLDGACGIPPTLDWDAFMRLEQVDDVSDFHCVTAWSRLDVPWRGVRFATSRRSPSRRTTPSS